MRIKIEIALEDMGKPHVYRAPSASRPGTFHYVFVYDDQRGVQCTCEGWQYHKNCKHIAMLPPQKEV